MSCGNRKIVGYPILSTNHPRKDVGVKVYLKSPGLHFAMAEEFRAFMRYLVLIKGLALAKKTSLL